MTVPACLFPVGMDNAWSVNTGRNIVLVGFMGTGKTAVGRILAERLGMRFVDMDDVIVERAGKSIPRIFAEDGEPYFRSMERRIVQDLASEHGLVIAAGGGVVTNPDNVADFEATCLVVCLNATPEVIFERVARDTNRPLLDCEDKMGRIRSLLEARAHLYNAIGCRVDTAGLTVDEVADRVAAQYGA